MNDRERKDNELGIDLDMKGLTLDSRRRRTAL